MKTLLNIFILLLALFSIESFARDVYVKPTVTSNGTYRSGHYRTSPNRTTYDNYSTKGNTNPYTGKTGSKRAY